MKGNAKVIAELNVALREELTAINQYFLHAEMCHKWGYHALGNYIKKQSIDEMKHAEKLIERILFLDATPKMEYLELNIGGDVKAQLTADYKLELNAVEMYNKAVADRARRTTTTRRASSSRCSSRTKRSTWSGSRRSSIRSRSWATRRTCRT